MTSAEKESLSVGQYVYLKYKTKTYKAILLKKATEADDAILYKHQVRLEKRIEKGFNVSVSHLSFLDDTFCNDDATSQMPLLDNTVQTQGCADYDQHEDQFDRGNGATEASKTNTEMEEPISDGAKKEIIAVLQSVKSQLDEDRKVHRRLRQALEKASGGQLIGMLKYYRENANISDTTEGEEIFDGEDLMQIGGSRVSQFANGLARKLFSDKELSDSLTDPRAAKTAKRKLSANRLDVVERCIERRFPGSWTSAKSTIDQLGRDTSRKMKKLAKCGPQQLDNKENHLIDGDQSEN